jgi:hypothetical protein
LTGEWENGKEWYYWSRRKSNWCFTWR